MGLRDDMEYGQYRREKIVADFISNSDQDWVEAIGRRVDDALAMCKLALECHLGTIAEQRIHDFRLALEEAVKILRGDDE